MENIGIYTAGTDALGRVLPHQDETGEIRSNRQVGMFYFLWCGEHDGPNNMKVPPLDVTKIIAADKNAGYKPDSDIWGGYSVMHHWGEPIFGYYYSRDEWVMRRHIIMLTNAGIDFLVIDTTNFLIYEHNAKMLLRLLEEYRTEGFETPKVVFYTNTRSGETAMNLYNAIYKENYMKNSWYYFNGKPLIIAKEEECTDELKNFFFIRAAQWPNEPSKVNGWPWMDFERPQRVFYNEQGEAEIINVSASQHPQIFFGDSALYGETANRGRCFHNGENDKTEGAHLYGYNIAEQWERALECDPPYVFVTGWNEWIMGRWSGSTESRPVGFVDCADMEYSRDIEPMRGGYSDNYYMQLIAYIRRYKGFGKIEKQPEINFEGRFPDWKKIENIYMNYSGAKKNRSCEGYGALYEDQSGRNEIDYVKTAHEEKNIYFYVKTNGRIDTSAAGTWMHIYIDTGKNNNFCGFDYIANYHKFSETKTALARCADNSYKFDIISMLEFFSGDDFICVTIPKNSIGVGEGSVIGFKVCDSKDKYRDPEDFYLHGDVAPFGRLKFQMVI